jgi:hypothetical protein
MDLSLRSESFAADDTSWLRSRHGTQATLSGTLDVSAFTAETHYPDGFIKSGTPLGRITATGKYGPYAGQTNEVQTVTVTGSPTGGTFTLTWSGQTTAAIAYNATASAVQAALESLSNIDLGDVVVTGGPAPGTAFTVTFTGRYAGTDVAAMTATASLTGGTTPGVTVSTTTAGGANPGTSDGRETLVGFLMFGVKAPADTSTDVVGAVFMHGAVVSSRLPVPVDSAGRADVAGRIWFV